MKRKNIEPLILDERDKQDAEWGGPNHDKHHTHIEWCYMLQAQLNRLMRLMPNGVTTIDNIVFKERMVKIAAISYAALEAQDD